MFKRVMGLVVAAFVMGTTTLVGCGGGEGTSGSGGSGSGTTVASGNNTTTGNNTTSGSSSFECCLNGYHFICPSKSAVNQCIDFNGPDPSACQPDAQPCGNPTTTSGGPATTSGGPATTGSGGDDYGKQCENNSDCIHNSCLVADGADFGYCTNTCMDFTDCPTFWNCTEVGNATGKYCVQ